MGKDMVKNELKRVMRGYRCPVCSLIERRSNHRIRHVLDGVVTNPDSRERFLDSEGFCRHHSERVLETGRPLSHAILYSNLLEEKRKAWEKKRRGRRRPCELCELELKNETTYLYWFAKGLKDPAFISAYDAGGVLCMHHLEGVRGKLRRRSTADEQLMRITSRKYDELHAQLEGIRKKHDYKHASESWTPEERRAWKRIVRLLVDQGDHRR